MVGIGNGIHIAEKWIPGVKNPSENHIHIQENLALYVKHPIDQERKRRIPLVEVLYPQSVIKNVLSVYIPLQGIDKKV